MERVDTVERHGIRVEVCKAAFERMPKPQQMVLKQMHERFRASLVDEDSKIPQLSLWGFLELVFELQRLGAL